MLATLGAQPIAPDPFLFPPPYSFLNIYMQLFLGMVFAIFGALALRYKVESTLDRLFIYSAHFAPQDKSFYFFIVTSAEVFHYNALLQATGLLFMEIATSYVYPVSPSQITTFTVVGMSLARNTYYDSGEDTIVWFPELTIVVLIWLFVPFVSLLLSAFIYGIIKKSIMAKNSKIQSMIITSYLSGVVFVLYFSFSFATKYFEDLSFDTKVYLFSVNLFLGFQFLLQSQAGSSSGWCLNGCTSSSPSTLLIQVFSLHFGTVFLYCISSRAFIMDSNNKPFYEYKENMDYLAEAYKVQKAMPVVFGNKFAPPYMQEVESVTIPGYKANFRFNWKTAIQTLNSRRLTIYDRKVFASMFCMLQLANRVNTGRG
eukprot:TRINITY_DN1032_c0_g1_i2.p2 TRINITY_DN1032_c0_g1~~TRINITY_DN1032_c0_g1_i2.p2  ORF type:complete len:370 (+),score=-3.89 TRINITY_DN1032_c0_g1_i2:204-1313(+)